MKRLSLAFLAALGSLVSASPALAVTHYQQVEICSAQVTAGCASFDASGNLRTTATGGSTTVTFPYDSTANQTAKAASFVGVAGWDGANVQPIAITSDGYTLVKTSVDATAGDNIAATGFSAVAGYGQYSITLPNMNTGKYTALQVDQKGRLITSYPYTGATAQTQSSLPSFVGVAGFDGTNVTGLAASTNGVLETAVCQTGTVHCASLDLNGTGLGGGYAIPANAVGYTYDTLALNFGANFDATMGNNSNGAHIPASVSYGQYNASLPTTSDGNYTALQTDVNGRLITTTSGTVTTTLPYSSATGQTATANSFVGVAGFDGTNVTGLASSTSGVLDVRECAAAGTPCSIPFAMTYNAGVASAYTGTPVGSFSYLADGANTNWAPQKDASNLGDKFTSGIGLAANSVFGRYNSTPPTMTDAGYASLQTDVNGRLLTTANSTLQSGSTTTVTQATGTNLHAVVDSGTITANAGTGNFTVTQATASNLNATVTPAAAPTASATLASVSGSASSVTLLAAGAAINGWSICNESSAILYMAKTSTAASATAYSLAFPAAGTVATCFVETQPGMYGGQINGIWASATGAARVTSW